MERRQLGFTGIEVLAIGMGTWRTFDTDEDRSWLVGEALTATSRPVRPTDNARPSEPPMFNSEQRELVARICAAA